METITFYYQHDTERGFTKLLEFAWEINDSKMFVDFAEMFWDYEN